MILELFFVVEVKLDLFELDMVVFGVIELFVGFMDFLEIIVCSNLELK